MTKQRTSATTGWRAIHGVSHAHVVVPEIELFADCDDTPGGYIASYGAGIIRPHMGKVPQASDYWDGCCIGTGRTPNDAVGDALEQLAQSHGWDGCDTAIHDAAQRLQAAYTDADDAVRDAEQDAADAYCRDTWGITYGEASHDQQQVACDAQAIGDAIELSAVVYFCRRGGE